MGRLNHNTNTVPAIHNTLLETVPLPNQGVDGLDKEAILALLAPCCIEATASALSCGVLADLSY